MSHSHHEEKAATTTLLPPAPAESTQLGDVFDYGDLAGSGFEGVQATDISLPYLTILQDLSPQLKKSHGKYLAAASVGMLFNTVTQELFDGAKGVVIQPVDELHQFVEWKPRTQGGGFVGVHAWDSPVVEKAKADSAKFGKYVVNGNDLVETYYMPALIHRTVDLDEQSNIEPEPVILTFKSTAIKPRKMMMSRLKMFKGNPPLFAHRILVSTISETRGNNTSSNFRLQSAIEDNVQKSLIPGRGPDGALHPLMVAARDFQKAFRTGVARVTYDADDHQASAGAGDTVPF